MKGVGGGACARVLCAARALCMCTGNIIAAIATTNAIISGYMVLEAFKVLDARCLLFSCLYVLRNSPPMLVRMPLRTCAHIDESQEYPARISKVDNPLKVEIPGRAAAKGLPPQA